MIDKFLNIFKTKQDTVAQQEVEKPAVEKKTKPKKPRATKKKEPVAPKVDILKFDFDPSNPRIGSIELDWNKEFIELLGLHGYAGQNEEEIIDLWLNDICRTILANQYPGAVASAKALAGAKVVNKKDIGSGKTEIS
jgi:hypothetical protein